MVKQPAEAERNAGDGRSAGSTAGVLTAPRSSASVRIRPVISAGATRHEECLQETWRGKFAGAQMQMLLTLLHLHAISPIEATDLFDN